MSFILESIKQAERERKLGQQKAPEISIEYTGTHVDDIENNKMRWLLFLMWLMIAAILVWSTAYYLTNKDKQYGEKLSINELTEDTSVDIRTNVKAESIPKPSNKITQSTYAMVPVKKLHKSDLKSVKLINENEEAPTPIAVSETKQQSVKKNTTHSTISNPASDVKKEFAIKPSIEKPIKVATAKIHHDSDKQELVKIYADLAALENEESEIVDLKPALEKIDENQVQFKTASYVAPQVSVLPSNEEDVVRINNKSSYRQQHEQAVRSGVPSFGELPYDVQEKIPNFNVSVHMFHTDPQQRRIRINGQMYTEGKNLQQDLALVEITRYGAVFDYQGNLFRFNVR